MDKKGLSEQSQAMGRKKKIKKKVKGRERGPGAEIVPFLDTSSSKGVPTHTRGSVIRIPMCLPEQKEKI